uniref:Signal peptidase complex subunit 1 n=4 Tax=Triticinae TaxID=1648030 RepID=A0A453FVT5_AEGTS
PNSSPLHLDAPISDRQAGAANPRQISLFSPSLSRSSPPPATPAPRTAGKAASKMDWQGQKSAEMLMQVLLVASAVAAFLVGYAMADFQLMLLVYAGGVVLTTLVTVPNWPFFNRHPLKWLDAAEADRHPRPQISSAPATTGGKKKTGKNK